MAKVDYVALAPRIIELAGGRDNITYLTHCMTRLRFTVRDKSKVDEEGINETEGLKGIVWAGDQLQIVIGTSIDAAYDAVVAEGGFGVEAPVEENLDTDAPKAKRSPKELLKNFLGGITGAVVPGIPAFMAMGLFAALAAIIGPTGLGIASESDGFYLFLTWAQNAISEFMPVIIAYTAAVKFNASPVTAIAMMIICLYPELTASITAGEFNLFGVAPMGMTLSGQMIPTILGVWILSKVQALLKRVLPDSLKFVLQDFLALIVMVPLMIYAITPLGILLGMVIALPVSLVSAISQPLATAIASALWVPMVSVGLHAALAVAFMMDFYTTGVNYVLMPATVSLGFIALAVNLAVMLRSRKDKDLREDAKDGAIASFIGGAVEPSIYTIYLKYPKVMAAICAGMGVMGLIHGLLHVGAYSLAPSSFLGVTAFLAGGMDNFMHAVPGLAAGMVVAFALVMVLGVDSKPKE